MIVMGLLPAFSLPAAGPKADRPTAPRVGIFKNPLGLRIFTLNRWEQDSWARYGEVVWKQLPALGIGHVFMNVPAPEEVAAVQEKLAASDLKASVLRGTAELTSEAALAGLEPQLATCRKMGVRYMFLSPKHPGADKEKVYGLLRRLGDLAKRYDVTVCLETHPDLGANAEEHLETMKRVNHPNIRVNFDTGNITFYNQGTDAVAELKRIVDYVGAVDLKDHSGKLGQWNFPPLGQGVVKFPEILRVLREHGYQGPLTIELEGREGVSRTQQQIEAQVDQSVRYLRSLGEFD